MVTAASGWQLITETGATQQKWQMKDFVSYPGPAGAAPWTGTANYAPLLQV